MKPLVQIQRGLKDKRLHTVAKKMKPLLTLEQIKYGLTDRSLHTVSKKIDVSYPTLRKLADGVVSNYTYRILEEVSKYIRKSNTLPS